MVNGTVLNLRVIFDHWPKLHLGLDALINQKILKGIYFTTLFSKIFGFEEN